MGSKYYLQLLLNEYDNRELTREDLKSTLLYFADLYHKENIYKIKLEQNGTSNSQSLCKQDYLHN